MKVWKVLIYFLWRSSNWQYCFKMAAFVDNSPYVLYTKFQIFSITSQGAACLHLRSRYIMGKCILHNICWVHKETSSIFRDNGENLKFCVQNIWRVVHKQALLSGAICISLTPVLFWIRNGLLCDLRTLKGFPQKVHQLNVSVFEGFLPSNFLWCII